MIMKEKERGRWGGKWENVSEATVAQTLLSTPNNRRTEIHTHTLMFT